MTRPLRGAALIAARNTRTPATPGTQVCPDPADLPDLQALLHHPEVSVRPDEPNGAVAVLIPAYLAKPLAHLHPDPVQFLLAVQIAQAAVMDEDERRDLLRTEPNP